MDIAERKGDDLRLPLRSAERFSERAISIGLREKARFSRSRALLRSVTRRDQRRLLRPCFMLDDPAVFFSDMPDLDTVSPNGQC